MRSRPGTRDLSPEDASEHLAGLTRTPGFACFPRKFKKIDSVLRGNTAHETCTAIRLFGARLSIIAPAYPALGRTSVQGVIHVRDLHGKRQIPALEAFRAANLNPLHLTPDAWQKRGAEEIFELALRQHSGIVYSDAAEQHELGSMVRSAAGQNEDILWIGSGGLAHALAASSPPHVSVPPVAKRGTVLVFVGSDHPVSQRQLAHLREHTDVTVWVPGTRSADAAGAIVLPVACERTTEREISRFAGQFQTASISCLFMTGGDTAALVCRALEIQALDLHVEFAPGLPQGIAVGGRFDGHTVVLKSGGFGEAATVSRVVHQFSRRSEVFVE